MKLILLHTVFTGYDFPCRSKYIFLTLFVVVDYFCSWHRQFIVSSKTWLTDTVYPPTYSTDYMVYRSCGFTQVQLSLYGLQSLWFQPCTQLSFNGSKNVRLHPSTTLNIWFTYHVDQPNITLLIRFTYRVVPNKYSSGYVVYRSRGSTQVHI